MNLQIKEKIQHEQHNKLRFIPPVKIDPSPLQKIQQLPVTSRPDFCWHRWADFLCFFEHCLSELKEQKLMLLFPDK